MMGSSDGNLQLAIFAKPFELVKLFGHPEVGGLIPL